MSRKPLLVELLTEELPPKALKKLGVEFGNQIFQHLKQKELCSENTQHRIFSTPRRLAVLIDEVLSTAPQQTVDVKLMPKKVGLTDDGSPSTSLVKKLESLNLSIHSVKDIVVRNDGKMDFLHIHHTKAGASLEAELQAAIEKSISNLPIPKVMTYQLEASFETVRFARPARGLLVLHGSQTLEVSCLGIVASDTTQGHRFLSTKKVIKLTQASDYEKIMRDDGCVIASFDERKKKILAELKRQSEVHGLLIDEDDALLDEVTALVEWPVVYPAKFEEKYLSVPEECLILTMKSNQKYFPLFNEKKKLAAKFLIVSNMASDDPKNIIEGNEKVIRPRLADAQFFYESDLASPLTDQVEKLKAVVFHNKLGSQYERVVRIQKLAISIAESQSINVEKTSRAAWLCKADLMTDMVGEFPELQGIIGNYYARAQGEDNTVAESIEQHYRPRFANDSLPENDVSTCVALADKIEMLIGIFGIGLTPTGDKDPFALRRQAIGIIRILIDNNLDLRIDQLINWGKELFSDNPNVNIDHDAIKEFIIDRLRGYLKDRGASSEEIEAILAIESNSLNLVQDRLIALQAFSNTEDAKALAAANKRIKNILNKNPALTNSINESLLSLSEEITLHNTIHALTPEINSYISDRKYGDALKLLCTARESIDQFFENVMVISDDESEKTNRLALLSNLSILMNCVGDLSVLSTQ